MAGALTRVNLRPKDLERVPMQTRLAPIGGVDLETRTAELVWSSGAQ